MKAEAQRIAIATACGIKPPWTIQSQGKWTSNRVHWTIPDYLNSLDAMHEAVSYLRNSDRMTYLMYGKELERIVAIENSKPENEAYHGWMTCDATAAQRAKAFLRTVGKWQDEQTNPKPTASEV